MHLLHFLMDILQKKLHEVMQMCTVQQYTYLKKSCFFSTFENFKSIFLRAQKELEAQIFTVLRLLDVLYMLQSGFAKSNVDITFWYFGR